MELGSENTADDTSFQHSHGNGLLEVALDSSSDTISASIPADRDEAISTEPMLAGDASAEVSSEEGRDESSASMVQPPASLPNGGIEGKRSLEDRQRCDRDDPLAMLDGGECKSEMEEAEVLPSWMAVPGGDLEPTENADHLVGNGNVPEAAPVSSRRRNFFMIRMPRVSDDKLRSKIRHAELQLEEASKNRDVIRAALQLRRASKIGLLDKLKVVRDRERACKDDVQKKRLEIDPLQSALNKLKFADTKYKGDDIFSEDDLDNKIASLQHRIQHESIPLKEEKQLIREIKQLESQRSQVCANDAEHAQLMENYGSKEDIQNQLEIHYNELDLLRANQNQARFDCKPIEKDLEVLNVKIDELVDQLEAAKRSHASALTALKELKKNLNEQNVGFYRYRDSLRKAKELASAKNLEALSVLCNEQVESILSSWNNDLSFRERYMKNNIQSTLRRLETLDGRSLGVHEEPLLFLNDTELAPEAQSKDVESLTKKMTTLKEVGVESCASSLHGHNIKGPQGEKARQQPQEILQETHRSNSQKKEVTEIKKPEGKKSSQILIRDSPPSLVGPPESIASSPARIEDAAVKEAQAAELKEKQRQEQIAKAREAAERKKRQAERAQVKAQLRAQKEAERREKERAKKAKKKSAFSAENSETLQSSEVSAVENEGSSEVPEASVTRSLSSGKGLLGRQVRHQRQPAAKPHFIEKLWQHHFTWLVALFFAIVAVFALFLAASFWN